MIILENVSKFIISNLTLHIPQGECVGVIGASGAGKTTLLKLISGLLSANNGYVRTLGKNSVLEKGTYGRAFSVFFAEYSNLEKEDSVKTNLEILGSIYRMSKRELQEEYQYLAEYFGFKAYENEKVSSLSLGQRMRVELGAALMMKPKLLLLDEPDVGLDENAKAAFWNILEQKQKEGVTIVVSSHNLIALERHCSRIILMEQGNILFYGSSQRLHSKLASINKMKLKIVGAFPDLDDLPLLTYGMEKDILTLSYDTNYLSSAEIIGLILNQTQIDELTVMETELAEIIMQIKGAKQDEFH